MGVLVLYFDHCEPDASETALQGQGQVLDSGKLSSLWPFSRSSHLLPTETINTSIPCPWRAIDLLSLVPLIVVDALFQQLFFKHWACKEKKGKMNNNKVKM